MDGPQGRLQRGRRGPGQVVHAVGRDRPPVLWRLQAARQTDGPQALPPERGQVSVEVKIDTG